MTDYNYGLALKYYSYKVLEAKLKVLLDNMFWDNPYV